MNGELLYARNPLKNRRHWIIFYVFLASLLLVVLYYFANQIRTHTLPVGQIQLTVPYSKYLVGETVNFTMKNSYNSPVYLINNCPAEPLAVYRQENGKWVRIHDQASLNGCSTEQRQVSVPANGIVNGSFAAWHHLFDQPGQYLIVAFVEYYNASPYQEFSVINAPASPAIAPKAVASATPTRKSTTAAATTPTTTATTPQAAVVSPAPAPTPVLPSQTVTTSQGSITVQYSSSNIYVISIAPASSCKYKGGNSGPKVQVTFICGENQTQVTLTLVNGQLVQNIQRDD